MMVVKTCVNLLVLRRWFAALAVLGCLCTLYLSNPSFVAHTLAKMDYLYVGNEKSKVVPVRELLGMLSSLSYHHKFISHPVSVKINSILVNFSHVQITYTVYTPSSYSCDF